MTPVYLRTESSVFRDDETIARVAVCRVCDWRATQESPNDVSQAAHDHALATDHVISVRNDYHRTTEFGIARIP